jgi:tetratricopeptide (TPR) repeat protein
MITPNRESSSFGVMLKAFRTRRHLTQRQLAEALGVHRHAILRWEQGEFLPAHKTLVLELARCLHLDEQETRLLLEASFTAPSPHWYVPLPRNPFFTGREEILAALHTQLSANQVIALTQSAALHGLGGVGKTQLALEYAYRYALEYSAIFWIGAETSESILSSLLHIAEALELPERDGQDQQRVVAALQRWFSTHSRWLLVWDNVEDLALLDRFLPSAPAGAILLTTRSPALGTLARGIDLLPMEREERMLFLLRRAKVLDIEATHQHVQQLAVRMPGAYAAAEELATAMGGLPLALDQAGAYIEETQCDLPAYLELFRSRRADLLQQRGEKAYDHPASVSVTFRLSIAATTERHPAAWDLLQVCALLSADAIPEELFRQGAGHLGAQLQAACSDELEWNRLVAVACSCSLLLRQPQERTLSMHRLVQAVLQEEMSEQLRVEFLTYTVHTLNALFPETTYEAWKQCERVLPHVMMVAPALPEQAEDQELAELLQKAADWLRLQAQYAPAQSLYERALRIQERVLGPIHPNVAAVLNRLAAVLDERGEPQQAVPLYERALRISEQALGPEHPDLAYPLHNLASFYFEQQKYQQAEPLYQRALHLFEQALGPEHSMVAHPLNGLADLYAEQGKYRQAEPLYERALRICEAKGAEHPHVALILDGLAKLYTRQEKHVKAKELHERALHIQEQAMGLLHPYVAYPLIGLADLSASAGKYQQAELLYRRASSIRQQALGPDHPLVAASLGGLANLYREQGNSAQAEDLYQRILSIREQRLGQHHPDTAQTLHDLTILRWKQGRLNEALSLAERVLQIRVQALGDDHPKTRATRTLCAQLKQGRMQEGASSQADGQEISGWFGQAGENGIASEPASAQAAASPASEDDPLAAFLATCCELHPRAWSRAGDLWGAYKQWTEEHHERFPLSRRAFTAQLKTHGCRAGRTNAARIWRGITLVEKSE